MVDKAYQSLTPGQKREKAKEKARKDLKAIKDKARKYRKELQEVQRAAEATPEKPKDKGAVITDVPSMEPITQEIVHENVIFEPNEGPQTDFLAAPETDVLYGGAAGGGKSHAMVVDPLRFAHIKEHRALILRKSLPELRELIDKTRELYPQAFPGCKYNETNKIWKFPSGATVEFGYLDKEADVYRYQGQAFSWIGFDEITHLASEFAWNYLASRLRTTNPEITCYMRCTANPGGPGHAWVKARYIEPSDWNTPFMSDSGITRRFIPAKLSDNKYLYENGNYERMLKSMDEVTRRRLLEGDWDVAEGAAFSEFNKSLHVVQQFTIPADWNRIKAVDYGFTAPSCCLWGAVDPEDGSIYVYRELYERGLDGDDLKMRITEMEHMEHRGIPGVLDGACWNRTGYSGPTIGETLTTGMYGHKLRPADKNRIAGKVQVHQYLRSDAKGKPRLFIFENCKNLIREIAGLPLSKTNSEDVDTHADDHAYDALRYMLMSRPKKMTLAAAAMQFKSSNEYTPTDESFGY